MDVFNHRGGWWLAACLGVAPATLGQMAETRTALEKWVETRQIVSATRAEWQTEKDTLEQTVTLFERELKGLADQMTRVGTNTVQVELERSQAARAQDENQAALARIRELVGPLEARLRALAPVFPPPLTERLQPLLDRMPSDPAITRLSPTERLQNVVTLLNEADKFNGAVTIGPEVKKAPDGAEVQVQVMYLGLGQAFFVDKAGEYAGVGVPTRNGWEWSVQNDLAPRLERSLSMYQNAIPAEFIALPMQLK